MPLSLRCFRLIFADTLPLLITLADYAFFLRRYYSPITSSLILPPCYAIDTFSPPLMPFSRHYAITLIR